MTKAAMESTFTGDLPSKVDTRVADKEGFASDSQESQDNYKRWESLIRNKILEWERNPAQLEDEDIVPPSRAIIRLARDLAWNFRRRGLSAPSNIVPTGDGGIAFERRAGASSQSIEISEDGSIELFTFENARLISRMRCS